jgi:hypothetical protein
MKNLLKATAAVTALTLLLLPIGRANEAVCKPQKVMKVSRLCVYLINQAGEPVPGANLIVWKSDQEIAQGQTEQDGKFSFNSLKEGSYKVVIRANGYQEDEFPIVVAKPSGECNRAVQVLLYVGWLPCRGIVNIVKPG